MYVSQIYISLRIGQTNHFISAKMVLHNRNKLSNSDIISWYVNV